MLSFFPVILIFPIISGGEIGAGALEKRHQVETIINHPFGNGYEWFIPPIYLYIFMVKLGMVYILLYIILY